MRPGRAREILDKGSSVHRGGGEMTDTDLWRSTMEETLMEECFYCGDEASQTDVDRLGKCPSCMEKMTRAAVVAARESMGACYTVGSIGQKMY
jgi:hypothetical protein